MTIRTRVPSFVSAVLLGLIAILGPAAAASAAPPEINQKDCEAAGGTFDRVKGVKSCTTTATSTQVTGPYSAFYDGGFFSPSYRAFWQEQWLWQITTVESQKGNGDVTTQQGTALLSRQVVNQQCQGSLFGSYYPATVADCAAHGLYPTY
jgi:hypothetical protein